MRRFRPISLFLLVISFLSLFVVNIESVEAAPITMGNYIVVLQDNVASPSATALEHASKFGISLGFVYEHALKGYSGRLPTQLVGLLKKIPEVAYVMEDREVSLLGNVPLASGDSAPTGVRRIEAATTTTAHQASNVNVAVIDTGVYLAHPDLNVVSGKNCVRTNRNANDDNGHGTHVAGTIAAKNTGAGVVGVAPGTKIYAVKVLNSQGSGTFSQIVCGIDWVTANAASLNIKVASMSLGGGGSNDNNCGNSNGDAMHKAICRSVSAGVTYVVAAGNSATNLATSVPAAYPEVLTVTAMSDSDGKTGATGGALTCRTGELDDKYATFSNYGVSAADINHTVAGPGVCIYSTWLNNGYNTISGTSMATPHVSGSVALCFGNGGTAGPCAGLTPAQVVQKMRSDAQAHATASNGFTGDPFSPIAGKYFGYLVWDGGY